MAYTSHGYHIPGSEKENFDPEYRTVCGGSVKCDLCRSEVENFRNNIVVENPFAIINRLVKEYVDHHPSNQGKRKLPPYETYVYLFAYVLGGWKAMASTTLPDGRCYEITYDANKKRTRFISQAIEETVIIPDHGSVGYFRSANPRHR
jgi:hypothetical protein